jgi:hypothetical protein
MAQQLLHKAVLYQQRSNKLFKANYRIYTLKMSIHSQHIRLEMINKCVHQTTQTFGSLNDKYGGLIK